MPDEIKTTNIRLPLATWQTSKNILIAAGGKETLNALIVRLLDEYNAKTLKKLK